MQRPTNYIAANADGTYDAMVPGRLLSRRRLGDCTRHVRQYVGLASGLVPLYDRRRDKWREVDVQPGKGGA